MASSTTLTVNIDTDASGAVAGFDKATGAVKSYGDAASTADKQTRDIGGSIENTGDSAANVTTGLRDLGGAMQSMGGTVGAMGTAMVGASTAFEALDGAATLYKGAQSFATMAAGGFTKALNIMRVSILTNPIFIIAAIIIAIAIAFVLLWKNCETFRRIVTAAFNAVWGVIKAVWGWIKANWPLLLAILTGPIGIAVLVITKNWDKIKSGVQSVIDWIRSHWSQILGLLTAPFTMAWNILSGIFAQIRGAIDTIIGMIKKIKPPSIDFTPWSKSAPTGLAAPGVTRLGATRATTAGSAGGVTVNVSGALDPDRVAQQIRSILAGHDRRIGTVAFR